MKRALWLAGSAAVLLAALLAYAAHRVRSLNEPEFKRVLLERVRAALGAEVQAKELDVSLFRGLELKALTVANPPGYSGSLLSAEAFRLRYDLLPLLRGRLQVDELALDKPVLSLAASAKGVFNYEKLGSPVAASQPRRSAGPGTTVAALPLKLVLSRLAVTDARISMVDHVRAVLVKVEDADLTCRFEVGAAAAQGSGTARIATLNLGDLLFVRKVSAPIELSRQTLRLGPIEGTLADGAAAGDLKADLKGGLRYWLSLEVRRAQLEKLLQEARSGAAMTGALEASASFEGSGGLPTVKGRGRADVSDCKVRHSTLLAVVAATLQIPELTQPDFEECRVEFSIARSRVETPVLSLKGPAVQLTGAGSLNLNDDALAYDMTLALDQRLLGRIPIREMRAAFKQRGDGLAALDFKVSGTSDAPQTDIVARIGRAGAAEVVKGAIGKFLGRRKKP